MPCEFSVYNPIYSGVVWNLLQITIDPPKLLRVMKTALALSIMEKLFNLAQNNAMH